MNVYIVSNGERGEGDTPRAVFATLAAARGHVLGVYNLDVARRDPAVWLGSHNQVDEVYIRRMAVREAL